ncbi:Energy-coupling factor transporter transmembrane protein EcfT [Paenibacillus plantiphilus]|uniref:Energy-coupling factor transporter transmembrane protein EcfT n=2 Tax=Paenibacillus plantiphilus TaxID=2905650 RepID=A0ABN8G2U5_9BACL|nr:Energy-coupling factor transporter transmembrane protein EcfT [Paenibacillus plantiphilus]
MNRETLPTASAAGQQAPADRTGVALEDVWVYPGDQGKGQAAKPLLQSIRCRIEPNTITLIAGTAGSGKTTLLQTIAGLMPLSRGAVRYGAHSLWEDGNRLHALLHRSIGIVFQYPERQLFADSIEKEFRYSLRPYRLSKAVQAERIDGALRQMGLPTDILSESFLTLSDGQKRKVALATTLATRPTWLLLDEPTAGIDPQGVGPLLRCLKQQKEAADGGVIVVSHDLDTFLPLADRVLILHNGALAAAGTPQELLARPELWLETEIGLPSALQLMAQLREAGTGMGIEGTEDVPLTAEAMADRILGPRERESHGTANPKTAAFDGVRKAESGTGAFGGDYAAESGTAVPSGDYATEHRTATSGEEHAAESPPEASILAAGTSEAKQAGAARMGAAAQLLQQLHPSAKWIVYVLLTAAILMQHSWAGIGVSALLTGSLIILSGVAYRSLLRPAKPFLYFIVISTVVSGITIIFASDSWLPERIYFSTAPASKTFELLVRFLFVMLLGILLAVTTGAKRMQMALEQALSFLERFGIPVAPFAFAATLLMRFLPRLLQEMDRMLIIVQARGKSQAKKGSLRLREIPVFLIPFLLSMMKYAEDLSLTLEARGYQLKRLRREGMARLPWTRREWICIAAGVLLFAVLYMWAL